jgi:hypothetical protein
MWQRSCDLRSDHHALVFALHVWNLNSLASLSSRMLDDTTITFAAVVLLLQLHRRRRIIAHYAHARLRSEYFSVAARCT